MMKHIAILSAVILVLTLARNARAVVDDLEDIGPDCTPVTTRVVDGVTVTISTSAEGVDMTAATYYVDNICVGFQGHDGLPNAPLNPENVSGTRFISSSGAGIGFHDTQPIIFEFDAPVTLFGLTTLDLLEDGATCDPDNATLTLQAYDASGGIVDEQMDIEGQGPSGLDLDWSVSGNQIVKVELTGANLGDCGGHGIDDLVVIASPPVDDLEDIGPDCTPVTTRIVDGVTVTISTSAEGVDMTAATYYVDNICVGFQGHDGLPNAPLNPENVSGTRFISSSGAGIGFHDTQPIIFEFDAPVTLFGLTTLDLLEDGATCDPDNATLTLQAYDASGGIVDEQMDIEGQGPSGLDLDWSVSGNQIVKVELTGANLGDCGGYGIDDLVLTSADCDDDGFPNDKDVCPCVPAPAGVDAQGRPLGDIDTDCDVDLRDHAIMQQNFTGPG